MDFQRIKVNNSKLFCLGKDLIRDEFIMSITICGIAWYEQYFSISKDEFNLYEKNEDEFMSIYEECIYLSTANQRFLCSDMIEENNCKQLERLKEGK
ncbi:hypothetical protein [Clostridium felsineum]|uniref:hypothetical protein n=1 Tax=Clostridium felsineum TaxID=36839 RepID=UPI00098C7CD0|nr:hypothetical protein [Clostridium felsineum]URZ04213.1 hypothetical protein CLAUR_043010 [Clostridium felsineum]